MSPAVRHADYAALDMWRQLDGYDYATFAARHRNMVPVVNIQCRGIVWMNQQCAPVLATRQDRQLVHPRVHRTKRDRNRVVQGKLVSDRIYLVDCRNLKKKYMKQRSSNESKLYVDIS